MNTSTVFAICNALILGVWVATGPLQDQQPTPQDLSELSARELVILYAQTRMELADAELSFLQERPQGMVHRSRIERARSELAIAKTQYDQAMLASSGGLEKVRLAHAQEKVRLAKLDRDKANELVDGRLPARFSVERAELRFRLAQIKLELLKNPENHVTLIEAMQAQIDQLNEDVLSLDLRLTKLENKS